MERIDFHGFTRIIMVSLALQFPLNFVQAVGFEEIDPEYHTYEEFTLELRELADTYPGLCKLDSIGPAQQFQRTVWCMKVSDNAEIEEDEIALLYIGVHHACEVMGGETLLYMMTRLLEDYGTDPEITFWVDNYEIFFIPLMNPDGHHAVTSGIFEYWRKNARDTNQNGVFYEFQGGTWWMDNTDGVDLDRNYDWFWEHGGSGYTQNCFYRGESPFSESECQAVRDLGIAQHFLAGISFHSYGEYVAYPWDYLGTPAPDQDILDDLAEELASRFIRDSGGNYSTNIQTAHSGECENWFYGDRGALFFRVEVNHYAVMIPPGEELAERTERYYNGAKYLLERANGPGITGHVTDAVTGEPLSARVHLILPHSGQVEPRYTDPDFGRYTRLLMPDEVYIVQVSAEGYDTVTVDIETDSDTLTIADFQLQLSSAGVAFGNKSKLISADFTLDCAPNPFNASTEISFSLSTNSTVKAAVYNLFGQEVAVLLEGMVEAGDYRFNWDAKGLSSGIYLIRVNSSHACQTVKAVLVK